MLGKDLICTECAMCCTAPFRAEPRPERWKTGVIHGKIRRICLHLDLNTLLCTIYETRPIGCKEFEPGCKCCLNSRDQLN